MSLTLSQLTPADLDALYPIMQRDFPPDELKPLSRLHAMHEMGLYHMLSLEEDGVRRGYAFLVAPPGRNAVLLDYLAMDASLRGGGYGSACLRLLQERYPGGIVLETEAPEDAADEADRQVREKRIRFYHRAGFRYFPFYASAFGVHFHIQYWQREQPWPGRREVAVDLDECYHAFLPEEIYRREIRVELPEQEN